MADIRKKEAAAENSANVLGILEFTIAGRHFGINVAKVDQLMPKEPVMPMPNANPYVEGIFKPRNTIMTLINLAAYLGLPEKKPSESERDIYLVTNFNKNQSAFHVHTVEAIHYIPINLIEKPDVSIYGGSKGGLATGIARVAERLVTIIDFEKILMDISPSAGINVADIDRLGVRANSVKPILIAEDSQLLESIIVEALHRAGYANVIVCANGQEAWERLEEMKQLSRPIQESVACVITDIEMPQMDGHRLTQLIRQDEVLKVLPVIIFSSLINQEMRQKGDAAGATAQLSKPEITELVHLIDKHIL